VKGSLFTIHYYLAVKRRKLDFFHRSAWKSKWFHKGYNNNNSGWLEKGSRYQNMILMCMII